MIVFFPTAQERIDELRRWLMLREERVIVLVGHGVFWNRFFSSKCKQDKGMMKNGELKVYERY
jgi:hypothetical protein